MRLFIANFLIIIIYLYKNSLRQMNTVITRRLQYLNGIIKIFYGDWIYFQIQRIFLEFRFNIVIQIYNIIIYTKLDLYLSIIQSTQN